MTCEFTTLVNDTRCLSVEELEFCKEAFFGFFNESELPGKPNWNHWISTWSNLIEKHIGYLFATIRDGKVVAVLGALCYPCMLTAELEMVEAFWWCVKKYRGSTVGIKLLKYFEKAAKDLGAVRIKMIYLCHLNPETMKDIYMRMGYKQIEIGFIKEVA